MLKPLRLLKRRLSARLVLLIVSILPFYAVAEPSNPVRLIYAGTLLAVPGQPPESERTLVVKEGRIAAIKPGYLSAAEAGLEPGSVEIIDLKDVFVLPGLMDMHTHLTLQLGDPRFRNPIQGHAILSDVEMALDAAYYAERTLNAGFTTVRNMGSWGREIFALRDAIEAGKIRGPRVLAAGAYISATSGHGDIHGMRESVLAAFQPSGVCDGAAECRKAVRLQVKRGADVIKLTATGGASEDNGYREAPPELFDDELREIVSTAHSLGRKVGAHAHGTAGINAALRAGVDSVEHGTFLDKESVRLFKKTGAYLVPTLMLQDYFERGLNAMKTDLELQRRKAFLEQPDNVAMAYRAGVNIALGTDAGFFPHGENARELVWYVKIGMTEMEAIKTATVNAAALIGRSADLGTLEPGKLADLIAVPNNPLEDISALSHIAFVMKEGRVYRQR
mgnify:CR=1 FL=1